MRNVLNRGDFRCTFDRCFDQVLENCATVKRSDDGTWINSEMQRAYLELHNLGVAHSVEVWQGGELVGGLYGLSLGRMFFGESMFSLKSNASKVAFVYLVRKLQKLNFKMIDCQVTNSHLVSLGAREISRDNFMKELEWAMNFETIKGSWSTLMSAE
jgi:leucyl/phenylalanyl-tRNA--protein transferase